MASIHADRGSLFARSLSLFRTLRVSLRFVLPLALAVLLLGSGSVFLVDTLTLRWFVRDLDNRSEFVARTLQESMEELMRAHDLARIEAVFNRAIRDERLFAIALCDTTDAMLVKTYTLPPEVGCRGVERERKAPTGVVRLATGPVHVALRELGPEGERVGRLAIVHDMSFIERRSAETRRYVLIAFVIIAAVIALITMTVAHMSWRGWVEGVRAMLRGEGVIRPFSNPRPELQPLVGDLRTLLRNMEEDQRLEDDSRLQWTPATLKRLLQNELSGDEVILVSNREPYIHVKTPKGIQVQRPASGLVTAVEPVMRACSGTWIAHGSGSGDREASDAEGRVHVPPSDPRYVLRRLWLTKEEEAGYYYGFANEGLWPLCHIAHVRPVFRSEDWEFYRRVNERFADAVLAESSTDDPVVLVQDYHFALLPRLIRERIPRATIITFWHIPWPNPESFGICPWRDEIIDGLLGSTILGFHTRYHCRNFVDTVDRLVEARIEHEHMTISYGGHLTQVESYPISIAWPKLAPDAPTIEDARHTVRERLGLPPNHLLGLGVDRLDYTKGIVERLRAVERLLELQPRWHQRFTFVQIASPSRTSLDEYQRFESQVRAVATQVNKRFGDGNWQPVHMLIEHHDAESVFEHYRACDVCLVTSLHDGMNLVAKEFIAARDDERGVLLLSQFAGASRELHEALIVNPYHVDQVAEALHRALDMPLDEQRMRMRSLRQLVREFNVYRWAGRMLLDAARLRRRQRLTARIENGARAM
ncbi:MAG TPA: trehalose-6-phosphate synthase [Burkholderiaceae bacterium]|nr:trehalose-6-phosphate synthase [Burkholderiaceae bacterium]